MVLEVVAQCCAISPWRRKEIGARETNGIRLWRKARIFIVRQVLTPYGDVPVVVPPADANVQQLTIVDVLVRYRIRCRAGEVVIHEDVVSP